MKNFYSHAIKKISKNFKAQPGTANKKIEKKCSYTKKGIFKNTFIYLSKKTFFTLYFSTL